MALPSNLKSAITVESASAHTQQMLECRGSRGVSNALVRFSAAKQFDEPSPQQARAIDKILRLPKVTEPSS